MINFIETTENNKRFIKEIYINYNIHRPTIFRVNSLAHRKPEPTFWIRHKLFDDDIGPFTSMMEAINWLIEMRKEMLRPQN